MTVPFENSLEHLNAELARLDLLLQREVWRWQQSVEYDTPDDLTFRGIYIAEAEIEAILNGVYPGSEQLAQRLADRSVEQAFAQALAHVRAEIAARKAAARQQGVRLRLAELQSGLGLNDFDLDVLLIALLPEIDLRYERIYAYLQDDITRRSPGVSLVLNLLCPDQTSRLAARAHFMPHAPLLRHRLILLLNAPNRPHVPLPAQEIRIDPPVAEFILGHDPINPSLQDVCELTRPAAVQTLFLPPDVQAQLDHLAANPPPQHVPAVVVLQGDPGTGRHTAAQNLCAAWRRPLLTVNMRRLAERDAAADLLRLIVRDAWLSGAAVYWRDDMSESENTLLYDRMHSLMLEYPVISIVPLREGMSLAAELFGATVLIRIALPRPAYALRCALWRHFLSAPEMDEMVPTLAQRFRLTGEQIRDAVADARHRAAQRLPPGHGVTADDLFAAARARTVGQLEGLARRVQVRHTWADLVLPDDQLAQLRELCDQMNYRARVLDDWGFDRKLSLGKGLNVLFAGPSGTGKTMAAEVIAGELGLDLFKIDLSTVVSKYVGETEKNLERIFVAAHNSNAILFFDEADALFGKRSEVHDAHDRYANIEISYLLQKMEEYEGLTILTTNLSKNIDEAFVRRMHLIVEFPYPEREMRHRLWQMAFPAATPLAPDMDFALLADRYRLSGGNVRNIALTAAFLAARDGGVVNMQHILWAIRREFQKLGRLADEHEFEVI